MGQHFSQVACRSRIRENSGPLNSKSPNSREFGYGLLQMAKVLQNGKKRGQARSGSLFSSPFEQD